MSWTYDESLPTDKDKVRALIRDTDENTAHVTNEFIELMLEEANNDIYKAASISAANIAASYSLKSSVSIGPMSVDFSGQARAYTDLAAYLWGMSDELGTGSITTPYAGGLSKIEADKYTELNDNDFIEGSFRRGMHDNNSHSNEWDWRLGGF